MKDAASISKQKTSFLEQAILLWKREMSLATLRDDWWGESLDVLLQISQRFDCGDYRLCVEEKAVLKVIVPLRVLLRVGLGPLRCPVRMHDISSSELLEALDHTETNARTLYMQWLFHGCKIRNP